MAQKSFPWTNNATGDGTTGGYTALEWSEIWRQSFQGGLETSGGVLKGAGNELTCSGTATPIAVNTGAAFVYGKFYQSTASENLSVTTPVVGTTGGHVILRLDWTAQTVRLVAVRNTDGVNSTPSLTQSTSTQWEIRLATFTVTTAGVIALTDARAFAHFSQRIDKGNVDGMTVGRIPFGTSTGVLSEDGGLYWDNTNKRLGLGTTSPSLSLDVQGSAAEARVLASGTAGGAALHLRNNHGSPTYLGYLNFEDSAGNADGQIAYEVSGDALVFTANGSERARLTGTGRFGLGDSSPDYALDVVGQVEISPGSTAPPLVLGANAQGQRVDGLHADEIDTLGFRRQGGSATDWNSPGTNNYTPATMREEMGVVTISLSNVAFNSTAVTFPAAFSAKPIVLATIQSNNTERLTITVTGITASQASIFIGTADEAATTGNFDVAWLAKGPE